MPPKALSQKPAAVRARQDRAKKRTIINQALDSGSEQKIKAVATIQKQNKSVGRSTPTWDQLITKGLVTPDKRYCPEENKASYDKNGRKVTKCNQYAYQEVSMRQYRKTKRANQPRRDAYAAAMAKKKAAEAEIKQLEATGKVKGGAKRNRRRKQ